MDTATDTLRVEREIAIAARPETVWKLLVDPREMTRWMGQAATIDLRRGGRYRIDVIPGHPPGRAPFASDVAELFTVRDGKIDSFAIYFDTAPYPKPPGAE